MSAEDLPSLLKTAELLRITGLSPGDNTSSNTTTSSSSTSNNCNQQQSNNIQQDNNSQQIASPVTDRCPSSAFRATLNSCNIVTTTAASRFRNTSSNANDDSSGPPVPDGSPSPALAVESPTNVQNMINPSDFMDIDMTCVKEVRQVWD